MSYLKQGNDIAMGCLTAARRYHADLPERNFSESTNTYMRGLFDGMLSIARCSVGVERFIYQGICNEIRFLQRQAAANSVFLP
jgi:hypothetical protein